MTMATGGNNGSSGGTSNSDPLHSLGKLLGLEDSLDSKKIAKNVAGMLLKNSCAISQIIKRQWPKIDGRVWLYMILSVIVVGGCSSFIFIMVYVIRWCYLNMPPFRKWIPKMSAKIRELKVLITDPDIIYEDTVTAATERAKEAALRGSVEDQIDALLDALRRKK